MMDISIIGIGRTPVGEHWDKGIREIGQEAVQAAIKDADVTLNDIDALVVGNALGGRLNRQNHIAPLMADYSGLRGVESVHVESADASGGFALRHGLALIASGMAQTVVVLGVEKVTDLVGSARNNALSTMLDADFEKAHGATPAAMAGVLMRRYMHEYGVELGQFEGFSINAHSNGSLNTGAMYRNLIKPGRFATAPIVAPPVNLFDSAPEGDGACALVLTATERAKDMVPKPVRVMGSGAGSDGFALHDRQDPLFLAAANIAAGRAYTSAGVKPADVNLLELHDSFTVLSAMQLEAIGFAERGKGWQLAAEGHLNRDGKLPISTFGGLKARGNPFGATGVYQAAEVALQLRGDANENQIAGVSLGMTLNVGALGSSAVAHLFEAVS